MLYKVLLDKNNVIIGVFEGSAQLDGTYVLIDEELLNGLLNLLYPKKYTGEITGSVLRINNLPLFVKHEVVEIKEKTELEILEEKVALQDGAIMELAEIISTLGGI